MARQQNPIDGIIFDKDGTLLDFEATWGVWASAFLTEISGGDATLAHRLGQAIGFDIPNAQFLPASIAIAGTQAQVAGALVAHLPGISQDHMIERMNSSAAVAPMAEVVPLRPLIERLSARGLHLGVATNDAQDPARAHLQAVGILEFFPFIAGFDTGYGYKPDPGQLVAFAKEFDLAPGRVAMVGDSLHDLHAGRAAGMITIGVLSGPATARELTPQADVILTDIGELPAWIDEQSAKQ